MATIADLDTISASRRQEGMQVFVSTLDDYFKLLPGPWTFTVTDWQALTIDIVPMGGDVSGESNLVTVNKIKNYPVAINTPTNNQVLGFSGGNIVNLPAPGGTLTVTFPDGGVMVFSPTGIAYTPNSQPTIQMQPTQVSVCIGGMNVTRWALVQP